jgi:dTDP-4-amino-4,6-dideoxygalactose transaminase
MNEIKYPFARPNILPGEDLEEVRQFLETATRLSDGEECKRFENEFRQFIGGGFCLSTSSCAAALHMALLSLGIGPGDEVIVPAMTHVATVHAVELVGARPVFVDCRLDDGGIGYVGKACSQRTKALMLTHVYGLCRTFRAIRDFCLDKDLYLIEDCALSLGAKHDDYGKTHAGLLGDIGCFSFYPTKHLTIGEGGMFVTRDRGIYDRARRIRSFGKQGGNFDYDILHLGSNLRMSELHALIGRLQLRHLPGLLEKRKRNYESLRRLLIGSRFMSVLDNSSARNYYCFGILFPNEAKRAEAKIELQKVGIEPSVYYPHPVPRLSYYQQRYGYNLKAFPNALRVADCSLALPIGPHLGENYAENAARVLQRVVE